MIAKPIYLTPQGRDQLQAELESLRNVDRLELMECLRDASTGGDWTDSTEHALVEQDLAFVEARIRKLEQVLAAAEVMPLDPDPARVSLGDTVVLENCEEETEAYTIVGSAETNPAAGFISNESPLGMALLSHQVGDEVLIHAPDGDMSFRVVALGPQPSKHMRSSGWRTVS